MDESVLALMIAVIALVIAILAYLGPGIKNGQREATLNNTMPLQLQAYERLTLLCERIALPNLVSRMANSEYSAREMQVMLLESIKQEYEYNASQQIYVSALAWDAVRNLRDQTMLVINKVANLLPPTARAADLNKQVLEIILSQDDAALHTLATQTLNREAKKLMNG